MKSLNIALLLGNTRNSVTNWRKEKRPIIKLLEKYISDEEAGEFLKTGRIERIEATESAGRNTVYENIAHVAILLSNLESNPKYFSDLAKNLLDVAIDITKLDNNFSDRSDPRLFLENIIANMDLQKIVDFYFIMAAMEYFKIPVVSDYVFAYAKAKEYILKNKALQDEYIKPELNSFFDYVIQEKKHNNTIKNIQEFYNSWLGKQIVSKENKFSEAIIQHHLYAEQQFCQVKNNLGILTVMFGSK
jgi:predicted transcriptional regulator